MAKKRSKALYLVLSSSFVIFAIYTSQLSMSTTTKNYNHLLKQDSHETYAQPKSISVLNTSNNLQLWLIRHGERMDEVHTNESQRWARDTSRNRLFDPPLTQNGLKQATERGYILLKHLSKYKIYKNYYPKYIYSSPTQRTIGTAMKIAQVLNLTIKIIPGLSSCAAAVQKGELNKTNIDKYDGHHHWELYLKKCGFISQTYLSNCNFLTKQEIVETFGKNGVKILFDYKYIDTFTNCVQRLVNNSETNIVLAVTHREGIKYLDNILQFSHIPYCKVAKYRFVTNSTIYANGFQYFEDNENEEVFKQIFRSPFTNKIRDHAVVTDNYLQIQNIKLKNEILELRNKLLQLESDNSIIHD
eukprot:151800_1